MHCILGYHWHFPNRAALLEAIVGQWEAKTAWLITESRYAPTAIERIQRLLFLIRTTADPAGGNVDDAAMFLWARQDQRIAARVKAVEQQRIAYLQELFVDSGRTPAEAHLQAEFAYIAFVGYGERLERVGETDLGFTDFCRLALQLLDLQ